MHKIDRWQAYLECDIRVCGETSPVFDRKLGGELPEGWAMSKQVRRMGQPHEYFCPRHAQLEGRAHR